MSNVKFHLFVQVYILFQHIEKMFIEAFPEESYEEFRDEQRKAGVDDPEEIRSKFLLPFLEVAHVRNFVDTKELDYSREKIRMSLTLAFHYCIHARAAEKEKKRDEGWYWYSKAVQWLSGAQGSFNMYQLQRKHRNKSTIRAQLGGLTRATKFKRLEEETIRLYLEGKWKSDPLAAEEITPKIVLMSKDGNGDLLPSTTKPLQWIRKYKKSVRKCDAY